MSIGFICGSTRYLYEFHNNFIRNSWKQNKNKNKTRKNQIFFIPIDCPLSWAVFPMNSLMRRIWFFTLFIIAKSADNSWSYLDYNYQGFREHNRYDWIALARCNHVSFQMKYLIKILYVIYAFKSNSELFFSLLYISTDKPFYILWMYYIAYVKKYCLFVIRFTTNELKRKQKLLHFDAVNLNSYSKNFIRLNIHETISRLSYLMVALLK